MVDRGETLLEAQGFSATCGREGLGQRMLARLHGGRERGEGVRHAAKAVP